ncbi:variable surface lipoprotein [Metamycoplasma alkalescens]|uniref:variable surface lipoprotein n=1 Tax=Metamycoplasma alkalescens TaxID=45363 RepID=UPI003D00713C
MKKVNKILLALGSVASLSTLPLVAAKCGEPAKKPEVKTKLSDFVKETSLGEIKTKEDKPSEKEIIDVIKAKNEKTKDLTLSIKDITEKNAKVTSEKHEGEVEVTFTTKKDVKEESKEESKEVNLSDFELFEKYVKRVDENLKKIINLELERPEEGKPKLDEFKLEIERFKSGLGIWYGKKDKAIKEKLQGNDSLESVGKRALIWIKKYSENSIFGLQKKYNDIKSIFKDKTIADAISFKFE